VVRSHVFALLVLLAPYSAWADQPRAPKALSETLSGDAKAAYDAGKLLFGDGDYAGAEIKFKAAYDASGDARLLWNMAACEKSQRHYARTEALVREYVDKGGAQLTEQDRADAKALLETIDSFTVKLTLNVSEPDAEVFIDDVSVGKTPLAKPVVVDIGSRKIVVRKEGFKDFEQQVPVGGAATAKLDVKLDPRLHEGKVDVVTQPNAEIFLDGAKVGVGRYAHVVKSGGHTLRVVAEGMRSYQTEIVVSDDETRRIDVPLEREVVVEPTKPKLWGPGGEIAASLGVGDKIRQGGAGVFDLRLEIGVKPGWPTELAFVVDVGSIVPGSNNCGSDFHGPQPASQLDVSVRYAFQNCLYVKPGLLFGLHFTPRSRFDVYASIEAGFRFGFASSTSYDPLAAPPTAASTELLLGVDVGGRLGVDFHPFRREAPGATKPSMASQWGVGVFASGLATIISKEGPDHANDYAATPNSIDSNKIGTVFPWVLFGVRTSLTF
jgi:hypothetical protein